MIQNYFPNERVTDILITLPEAQRAWLKRYGDMVVSASNIFYGKFRAETENPDFPRHFLEEASYEAQPTLVGILDRLIMDDTRAAVATGQKFSTEKVLQLHDIAEKYSVAIAGHANNDPTIFTNAALGIVGVHASLLPEDQFNAEPETGRLWQAIDEYGTTYVAPRYAAHVAFNQPKEPGALRKLFTRS